VALVSNTRSLFLNDGQPSLPKVVASGFGGWGGVVGGTAVSVSVWFKTNAERKGTGTICAWGDDSTAGAGVHIVHLNQPPVGSEGDSAFAHRPHFIMGGEEFRSWELSGSGISDEDWHHFVFTCPTTGTPSDVKFYHNGSLATAHATSGSTPKSTAAGTFFRAGVDVENLFQLNAHIDELAVWNTELSALEVTDIYNSGSANLDLSVNGGNYASSASGQLWWRFEDPSADQVMESFAGVSGTNRTGFLPELFVTTVYRTDVAT